MAGEYSRELSVKTFRGCAHLVRLGYRQGGPTPYGLRRAIVDSSGTVIQKLERFESKNIRSHRLILIPGPRNEVAVVREIFSLFVDKRLPKAEIVRRLNRRGVANGFGRQWKEQTLSALLINEAYVGHNVWGRRSRKLKQPQIMTAPATWVRADAVFKPIIPHEQFDAAQAIIHGYPARLTDREMIDRLQTLYDRNGFLSAELINNTEGLPCATAYSRRFGRLYLAYAQVGYAPGKRVHFRERRRQSRGMLERLVAEIIGGVQSAGGYAEFDTATNILTINSEFNAAVCIVRRQDRLNAPPQWRLPADLNASVDIVIVARIVLNEPTPMDYYILPRHEITDKRLRLTAHNGLPLDAFRFDSLVPIYRLAAREAVGPRA